MAAKENMSVSAAPDTSYDNTYINFDQLPASTAPAAAAAGVYEYESLADGHRSDLMAEISYETLRRKQHKPTPRAHNAK